NGYEAQKRSAGVAAAATNWRCVSRTARSRSAGGTLGAIPLSQVLSAPGWRASGAQARARRGSDADQAGSAVRVADGPLPIPGSTNPGGRESRISGSGPPGWLAHVIGWSEAPITYW